MKVKKSIKDLIDNPSTRTEIARILKIGEQSVAKALYKNRPNGRMTKMDALMAISKVANIAVDQILEEEPQNNTVNPVKQ